MHAGHDAIGESGLLLLKIALVAALVAGIPLLAKRFGHGFAGAIIGLPVTTGPTLVLIAAKNGAAFASQTATSALASLTAVECFILGYALACVPLAPMARGRTARALLSLGAGAACFTVVGSLVAHAGWSVATALTSALAALAIVSWLTRRFDASVSVPPASASLAAARALVAGVVVVVLSELSSRLGPTWAGLLGTYPLAFSITATFAHLDAGGAAARAMAAGFARGSLGLVAFSTVFALLTPIAGAGWSTALGASLALAAVAPMQHLFARSGCPIPIEGESAV